MEKEKAVRNLERLKRLGILKSDEEYSRYLKEIEDINALHKIEIVDMPKKTFFDNVKDWIKGG